MLTIKCDSCKKEFESDRRFPSNSDIETISVSTGPGSYGQHATLHICKSCLEETGIKSLIEAGNNEPEPLIEALRELVREELDASRE